ncbi:MAG: rane fusion protein copper/silver efflux system [Alphaproteobacteria bacterium]|nr:rane fusion protein copper/silver efflux system [Alphaproteobacteria bacterium]
MRPGAWPLLILAAGAVWIGLDFSGVTKWPATFAAEPVQTVKPVLYYQDPDMRPSYSAVPKQTADGRAYRAVYAGEEGSVAPMKPDTAKSAATDGAKKIRYYRNPMGLPDISKTPKKDSMGMDYIPVYEGEQDDSSTITLTPGKQQRLGVATEKAGTRVLSVPIRAPGTIQLDERRISVVSVRSEAFVESVEDVTTGTEVKRGQPLLRLYSPAIVSAAAEFLSVTNSRLGTNALNGSRQRLLNLGVTQDLIEQIEKNREIPLSFAWRAPRDGIVLERNVIDGQRVMPGDVLFRVADHDVVWALVDIAERDLALIREGQKVRLRTTTYGNRVFEGVVALVYPHLNAATRSARVRIELPNADLLLRPDMYVEAEIDTGNNTPVVAVPESAVIDSGNRQVVIVDRGDGRFDPRPVTLGRRGGGYVEVKDGIKDGDTVVTTANFLIDAESNLKAALQSMTGDRGTQ